MTIPLSAAIGGLLLGLSAIVLLLFIGKIAGISGVAGGVFNLNRGDLAWRLIFLLGLIAGGWLGVTYFNGQIPTEYHSSRWQLVAAGLLVGLGTTIGNGCTSGHGICGVGRLSKRSIVATVVFMVVAIATVFVQRHLLGS